MIFWEHRGCAPAAPRRVFISAPVHQAAGTRDIPGGRIHVGRGAEVREPDVFRETLQVRGRLRSQI